MDFTIILLTGARQSAREVKGIPALYVPNQRERREVPNSRFSPTRSTDGSVKVPVGDGPERKSTFTSPTRSDPNSTWRALALVAEAAFRAAQVGKDGGSRGPRHALGEHTRLGRAHAVHVPDGIHAGEARA